MLKTLRAIAVLSTGVLASFLVVSAASAATNFYLANDAVTLDGNISVEEWGDPTIDDGEDDANRQQYCWNTTDDDWNTTTDASTCTTYVYDPIGMMDIEQAWFRANETNMLLALEMAGPMMAVTDVAAGEALSVNNEDLAIAGIDHLPNSKAFEGNMVFAFSTDDSDNETVLYDWYIVANLGFDLPANFDDGDAGMLSIYKEDGTTNGFQADEDTVAGTLDSDNSESSMNEEGIESAVFEISQNIENFYTVTAADDDDTNDIVSGQEVTFRLESAVTEEEVVVAAAVDGSTDGVTVRFDDASPKVTEDGLVIGAGAKKKAISNRLPNKFASSNVSVYADEKDGDTLLDFQPWDKKVGTQVATGDVDGDGEEEIVVMPFKKMAAPRIKVYDTAGNLEFSSKIHKKVAKGITKTAKQKLKKKAKKNLLSYSISAVDEADTLGRKGKSQLRRVKRYYLAVGDVDGDNRDDIVLTGATGQSLFLDVLRLNANNELVRTNQFNQARRPGYTHGSWVEIADITGNGIGNIVTSPMRGEGLVELWSISTDGTELELLDQHMFTTPENYRGGAHISATDGSILAVKHGPLGQVRELEWDSTTEELTLTDTNFNVGKIGNVYYDGTSMYYSPWKAMTVKKSDLEGTVEYTLDVGSRGTFIDYLNVE